MIKLKDIIVLAKVADSKKGTGVYPIVLSDLERGVIKRLIVEMHKGVMKIHDEPVGIDFEYQKDKKKKKGGII